MAESANSEYFFSFRKFWPIMMVLAFLTASLLASIFFSTVAGLAVVFSLWVCIGIGYLAHEAAPACSIVSNWISPVRDDKED